MGEVRDLELKNEEFVLRVPSFDIHEISKDGNIQNGYFSIFIERVSAPNMLEEYHIGVDIADFETGLLNRDDLIGCDHTTMTPLVRTAKILSHISKHVLTRNVNDAFIMHPRYIELFAKPSVFFDNPPRRDHSIVQRLESAKKDDFLNGLYPTLSEEWRLYILLLLGINKPEIYAYMMSFDHVLRLMICKSHFKADTFRQILASTPNHDIVVIEKKTCDYIARVTTKYVC